MSKPANGQDQGGLHKILAHPLRARILLTLQREGSSSPTRFSQATAVSEEKVSLNVAAYHFNVLADNGVINLIEEIPRRGATEHVYGINPKSPVPDIMRTTEFLQQIRLEEAKLNAEQEDEAERAVTILPVEVDEQGREELQQVMLGVRSSLEEIAGKCRRRLARSKATPIPMRVGLATYQLDSDGPSPPTSD